MLRIGICDDNLQAICAMEGLLNEIMTEDYLLEKFSSSVELFSAMEKRAIDILVLDIQLKNENGIQIAEEIQKLYPRTAVIFATGYLDYAEEIFDADPVYFLRKPVRKEKLVTAMNKALDRIAENETSCVTVKSGTAMVQIRTMDILYIESEKRYIHIILPDKQVDCLMKLDCMRNEMPDYFVRCHQSYLINLNKVTSFSNDSVQMWNGIVIPISRQYRKAVKESWLNYFSRKEIPNEG